MILIGWATWDTKAQSFGPSRLDLALEAFMYAHTMNLCAGHVFLWLLCFEVLSATFCILSHKYGHTFNLMRVVCICKLF